MNSRVRFLRIASTLILYLSINFNILDEPRLVKSNLWKTMIFSKMNSHKKYWNPINNQILFFQKRKCYKTKLQNKTTLVEKWVKCSNILCRIITKKPKKYLWHISSATKNNRPALLVRHLFLCGSLVWWSRQLSRGHFQSVPNKNRSTRIFTTGSYILLVFVGFFYCCRHILLMY